MSQQTSIDLPSTRSPLSMRVTDFYFSPINYLTAKNFIEKWHYSKNVNGITVQFCFGLYADGDLIGAMMLGSPATPGVAEAYNGGKKLIELRRLCCIDDTPKNTESYFIGQMLKWMKSHTDIKAILSYADSTYGHTGIIYKATNFQYLGQSPAVKKIFWRNKLYHDKALRVFNKGIQKPYSKALTLALKCGEAKWIETKPKHIFLKKL